MNALLFLLTGATAGILGCLYLRQMYKRKLLALRDEKIRLQKEKKIIVEFMHNLAVAIGEGVARKDLYQRIVHTAVMTTGAMSACVYEKLDNGKLRGIATEGLFPPQRRMKDSLDEEESTRASFLEKVLSSEILEKGRVSSEKCQNGNRFSSPTPNPIREVRIRTRRGPFAPWSSRR